MKYKCTINDMTFGNVLKIMSGIDATLNGKIGIL